VNWIADSGLSLLDEVERQILSGEYVPALEHLRTGIANLRNSYGTGEWQTLCAQTFYANDFLQHPVCRLVRSGLITGRSMDAGSGNIYHPAVIDAILGADPAPSDLSALAQARHSWELNLGFCRSIRGRHDFVRNELADLARASPSARILSVNNGYLREAAGFLSLSSLPEAEFIAFDRDPSNLAFIQREYDLPGLRTVRGSFRDLLSGETNLRKFDFIYALNLFDRLETFRARPLLAGLAAMLNPGGRILAANFAPELDDAAYLEAFLDCWPRYRSESELSELALDIPENSLRGQIVFREESGGSFFLDLRAT